MTRVISRMTLQQILAQAVGEDIIMNESNVVDFEDHGDKVTWAVMVFLFCFSFEIVFFLGIMM